MAFLASLHHNSCHSHALPVPPALPHPPAPQALPWPTLHCHTMIHSTATFLPPLCWPVPSCPLAFFPLPLPWLRFHTMTHTTAMWRAVSRWGSGAVHSWAGPGPSWLGSWGPWRAGRTPPCMGNIQTVVMWHSWQLGRSWSELARELLHHPAWPHERATNVHGIRLTPGGETESHTEVQ